MWWLAPYGLCFLFLGFFRLTLAHGKDASGPYLFDLFFHDSGAAALGATFVGALVVILCVQLFYLFLGPGLRSLLCQAAGASFFYLLVAPVLSLTLFVFLLIFCGFTNQAALFSLSDPAVATYH